jgi:hypothetical protein
MITLTKKFPDLNSFEINVYIKICGVDLFTQSIRTDMDTFIRQTIGNKIFV